MKLLFKCTRPTSKKYIAFKLFKVNGEYYSESGGVIYNTKKVDIDKAVESIKETMGENGYEYVGEVEEL